MAGAAEGEPRKVAQRPFCPGPSQCSPGVSASAPLAPTPPSFRRDCLFFFLCGGGNDSVVLRWCHGAASGLRGENSLSFARETQTRERRGLRAVPCGARGLADPGCCAAAAAAAAAAKAGGGLEWWWRRRQRQRPGSSSGSPSQLAAEAGERPALPGAQRRWLASGNNMGKTCPLAAARGEGGSSVATRAGLGPGSGCSSGAAGSGAGPGHPGSAGRGVCWGRVRRADGIREAPGGSSGGPGCVSHCGDPGSPAALVGRSLHS